MSDCVLCFSPIVNHNDKNLVHGGGQFKVFEEISSLQFVVHCPSPYIYIYIPGFLKTGLVKISCFLRQKA